MGKSEISSDQENTQETIDTSVPGVADGLNELSKVRELLFGQQAAELEVRIAALEANLSALGENQEDDKEVLQESLTSVESTLSQEVSDAAEQLNTEIEALNAKSTAAIESMEASSAAALEALKENFSQELSALEQQTQKQINEMVDRKQLASLLRSMADSIELE